MHGQFSFPNYQENFSHWTLCQFLQLARILQLLGNLQGLTMVSLFKTCFDGLQVDKTRKISLSIPSFQGRGFNQCFEEK